MAPDIPSQFSFEEMLSHTFPGFFTAITLFMLIAVLSPRDITSWATKDISGFAGFVGFVLIAGTILGIIIDGIHHSIIEDNIFEKITGLREINESLGALYPGSKELKLDYGYFFKTIAADKNDSKSNPIDILKYFQSSMYRYSEFYANTFISLIPFSLIAPFYLTYVLQIPWSYSLIIALISLMVACACLNGSYVALKEYKKSKFSVLCGYLGYNHYIKLCACKKDCIYIEEDCDYMERDFACKDGGIKLQAGIFDRANKQKENEGIEVIFNTTFGYIKPSVVKTDEYGIARATLYCYHAQNRDKCGTAIVIATSKGPNNDTSHLNFILKLLSDTKKHLCPNDDTAHLNGCVPGVTWVHIRRSECSEKS